jgi:tetratricopeptide (TPR) repeat protein
VALNKAHTSVWVKALIIVLIVAFVSLFMYQGIAGILDLFKSNPQTTAGSSTADYVTAVNAQNQSTVEGLRAAATSNPTSYTAAVALANGYFDWAQQLSQPQTGQSTVTTAAMTAAFEQWTNAKQAYDAATKLMTKFDAATQTDRSYAALYSNDATEAIAIVKVVTVKEPAFAQAWVHLGIYYEAIGDPKSAIPAYQRYLKLDPKGQNATYVADRLKQLGASATGSTSVTTTP